MDEQLQRVIDELFPSYDKNGSGSLDARELTSFFNEAFKRLGYKITVTPEQAEQSVQFIDKDSDKQVSKAELFKAMKDIISKRKPSQQPTPPSVPSQPTPPPTNPNWNQPSNNNWNQPPQQPQHNSWEQPQNNNWQQPSSNNWESPGGWQQPTNNWGQQPQPGGWNQPAPSWNTGGSNDGWGSTQFYSAEDNDYKQRIDAIFRMFDRDHSGSLSARELVKAFNHLLREMGTPITINQIQAKELLNSIDSTEDGNVDKSEFLQMLKYLLQQQPQY